MIIKEFFYISASNTDLLAAPSRLAAIPKDGVLTLEFSALDSDSSNHYDLTIQTPEGDVPLDGVQVPASGNTADVEFNRDTKLKLQFTARQGGHFLISLTETGTANMAVMATLTF